MPARIVALFILGMVLAGCGGSARFEIEFDEAAVSNPVSGPAVRIDAVYDRRKFVVIHYDPKAPSGEFLYRSVTERWAPGPEDGHSLIDAADLQRPQAKERIAGRWYSYWGSPTLEQLLSEGRTVPMVVGDILANGLRKLGYKVVQKGGAEYADARALDAAVTYYWFFAVADGNLRHRITVELGENWPLKGKDNVATGSGHTQSIMFMTQDDWQRTFEQGANSLIADMERIVRPAATAR